MDDLELEAEPMASYLTTATMGEFDLRAYRADGLRFWDAVDPDLYVPITPRTAQFAVSQQSEPSTSACSGRSACRPGCDLSFWVTRDTELDWDFLFVEARGRHRRLDDAPRSERPHLPGHRLLLPGLARAASVPRALPDRERRRDLRSFRHDGRVECHQRGQ